MDGKEPPDPGGRGKKYANIRNETLIYNDIDMRESNSNSIQANVSTKSNVLDNNVNKNMEHKKVSDNDIFKNKYDLKYVHLYDKPYYVYIQHKDKNIGNLHPMAIGKVLYENINLPKATIEDISKMGSNRIKVILKTISDINNLIANPVLNEQGYIIYVPRHLTQCRGVIRGVYSQLSEDYLLRNMESKSIVKHCKRMQRKIINNEGQVEIRPTETVVVTFEGNKLPSHIYINSVRCQVEPYIANVVQCYNCLRFGHVSDQCKSKGKTCRNCATIHEGECEIEKISCLHCKSSLHNSLDKKCPSYTKQREIKKIMAIKNLSFRDAKKIVDSPTVAQIMSTNNNFSVLQNLNDEIEFPSLPLRKNRSISIDFQNREPVSPVAKKRKTQITQEKHFSTPRREYNTQSLPLNPLLANPYRPSTSKEQPNDIIEQIIEHISDVVYRYKNKFSNNEIEILQKTFNQIINGVGAIAPT